MYPHVRQFEEQDRRRDAERRSLAARAPVAARPARQRLWRMRRLAAALGTSR